MDHLYNVIAIERDLTRKVEKQEFDWALLQTSKISAFHLIHSWAWGRTVIWMFGDGVTVENHLLTPQVTSHNAPQSMETTMPESWHTY